MRLSANAVFAVTQPSRRKFCALVAGTLIVWAAAAVSIASSAERQLAPGVMTTIPPILLPEETVSTHDLLEIRANPALEWKPEFFAASDTLYGMAEKAKYRREIFCLEFSFKPLRMIDVDLPLASGGTERKRVLYLVYKVRNTGQTLKPAEGADGVYKADPAKGGAVRFVPQFVLEANDRQANGARVGKSYLDQVIPAAVAAISQRETPGHMLQSSVDISKQPIPASDARIDRSQWGVATWIDVDPRIDFFSIFVTGLTNAYQWTDIPGAFHVGDPPGKGRQFVRKTLQLNFWRPGDELSPNEREFRFGVPLDKAALYDVPDGVAYRWLYR